MLKKWGEASILKSAKNLSDIVLKLFEYEKVDTNFNKIDTQELLNLNTEVDLKNKKPFKFIFAGEEVLVSSYVGMLNEFMNLSIYYLILNLNYFMS